MIEQIADVPDNVLGFRASGLVTADDYQNVLVPAIEATLSKTKRVRLLYILDEDFDSFTAGAAWEDTKVGLTHLTRFDRVAVVTNIDWIKSAVKAFGFAIPGEVRVFEHDHLLQAREWISAPPPSGDLSFDFLGEQGVLILRPKGELDSKDFARVSLAIDPHIKDKGALEGVMIVAEHFPGWDDLNAFFAHMRFVEEHRKSIRRLAFVTNDRLLSAIPHIASHFVPTESRRYTMAEMDEALAWVSQS